MQGDPKIDELMRPVMAAIRRHMKDGDAATDIYNRAYEALMISMDVNQPSNSDGSVTQNVLTDIKTSHSVKSDGSTTRFIRKCFALDVFRAYPRLRDEALRLLDDAHD